MDLRRRSLYNHHNSSSIEDNNTSSSTIIVPDVESYRQYVFNQVGDDKYMTKLLPKINESAVPILALCKTAKQVDAVMFPDHSEVFITFKYNDDNEGFIIISRNQVNNSSYARGTYGTFEVTESYAEVLTETAEDDDENNYICVEVVTRWMTEGGFKLDPSNIPVSGWKSSVLKCGDAVRHYTKWLIPMVMGQAALAGISYLLKGDPQYLFTAMSGFMLNKAANLIGDSFL